MFEKPINLKLVLGCTTLCKEISRAIFSIENIKVSKDQLGTCGEKNFGMPSLKGVLKCLGVCTLTKQKNPVFKDVYDLKTIYL